MLMRSLLCVVLVVMSAGSGLAAPSQEIAKGKIADASLQKLAPKSGFLTDQQAFAKLWKAWRPEEAVPEIDFHQHMVIVGLADGPNLVMFEPKLQKDGDLKFVVASTRMAGPGFGYRLVKISRDGVKTVNGKPIESGLLQGTIKIPAASTLQEGQTVEIKFFEFDPMLADVSADLLDEKVLMNIQHETGVATEIPFTIGEAIEVDESRRYYITVFGMHGETRTHIGQTEGERGLNVVLENGDRSPVHVILRALDN